MDTARRPVAVAFWLTLAAFALFAPGVLATAAHTMLSAASALLAQHPAGSLLAAAIVTVMVRRCTAVKGVPTR